MNSQQKPYLDDNYLRVGIYAYLFSPFAMYRYDLDLRGTIL